MSKEESPQITRRTTRQAVSTPTKVEIPKISTSQPLTLGDLVFGGEPVSLKDVISSLPGRRIQILQLLSLLGPLNSPMTPVMIYGGVSTGKTSTVLQIFRHLNRPFVYSSCRTSYNPRLLFESMLDQLLLHRKSENNGYCSARRYEKPSDFIYHLREALNNVVDRLTQNQGKNKLSVCGRMIYLIIDSLELVKEWDKSSTVLPLLLNLQDILKISDVGLIFISSSSPDTFYSDTGFTEPLPVHFPDYTEDDLRKIFLRNQSNLKLFSSFLDVVLKPFYRITRRVDELSTALVPLFKKYCEPLNDVGVVPNEEMKRRLFSHVQPHIASSLNEIFRVTFWSSEAADEEVNMKRNHGAKRLGYLETVDELDFHMSTSAKYLLISAYLASRNPATLDASLFDSTGGSDNRKRKRKSSETSMGQKENAEQELLMKGPGTFPLERLIAIYQCITSVADYSMDEREQEQQQNMLGVENEDNGLMSNILLQLSSLCDANFISKGSSCPLEGSTRYRSTASEEMALKVARSLKFPLSKYLYRR